MLLGEAGHRVEKVAVGSSALAALERAPVDLVLAEWEPPRQDGLALTRAIRRHGPVAGTHVVVLTSSRGGTGAAEVLDAGANDCLLDPFDPAELIMRVQAGLRAVELRAAEGRLSTLIANVPGAIYRCANDPDWTMELISDEIERISGYPASELVQNACRSFASVIHPDDHDYVADDGTGGVELGTGTGTGLRGLADRLAALGGRLEVEAAPGEGTLLRGVLPYG